MAFPATTSHRTADLSLPNETLVSIFDGLEPTTLADISQVSRRFNAVAERILYSFICITDLLSASSPIPAKTLNCCQSIIRRPHLIETIKRLQIRWALQGDFRVLSPQALIEACAEAGVALQTLAFLEGLDIFLGPANLAITPSRPIHAIERIVHGCHFPSLRYCSFGAEWTKGVQPYTNILPEFLTLVPSLRQLKISDHHAALFLPANALPSLSYFRGSPDTAAILLPGRPVHHLALVGQDSDVNRENLPKMALTSVPLRSLDLSAMQVRPTLLRNIASYLAALESLKVRLALRHTLHYALSGITLLAGLSSVLSDFHHLVCFDLSPTEIDGTRQANFAEEAALCTAWVRACPTLKRIVFPSGTEWQLNEDGSWA
ncbi:F-box domain-containing protein [Mycena venus]|uniref:F-box domain-containing protein n=1 Tax=Mycena venus TaxID=2733690 RepID=A0A8H7CZR5_9AGAR|nr:F-box domain-containing protein [Mycena venus]